jgi:MFS family permease
VNTTVFFELRFWLLVAFSVVLPIGIYVLMLVKRAISRRVVLAFGLILIVLAGVDVYLLQGLASSAKTTPSLFDDAVFLSELSVALYLLPAMIGGIGVNVVSHVLISHLVDAEKRFDKEHPEQAPEGSASTDARL